MISKLSCPFELMCGHVIYLGWGNKKRCAMCYFHANGLRVVGVLLILLSLLFLYSLSFSTAIIIIEAQVKRKLYEAGSLMD